MPDASEAELAWLAGLLEGEGSFRMLTNRASNGKSYRYPHITVNMTDRDVIERAAQMFGTGVYDLPRYIDGRKLQYRAQAQGTKAAALMRQLRPWMGQRRGAKIDEVLAEYDAQEPLEDRRRRSCQEAQRRRRRNERGEFVA